MGLFSKKPGGTFFGNLLRGVANKASGGILGNGANMIPLPSAPVYQPVPIIDKVTDIVKDVVSDNKQVQGLIKEGIWSKFKVHIIAGGLALAALITFLIVRKGGSRPRRR